ncbi:hypothetical protein E2C01_067381 [Portunus trituberculatus]|uniref:Uncharacterized protein n=1 Tax=Portunus trituberculatus TaxID=210409 RepID=A0A5B7HSG5_PORTR|nr:hypothetical protein [Portunus trituberculatus]
MVEVPGAWRLTYLFYGMPQGHYAIQVTRWRGSLVPYMQRKVDGIGAGESDINLLPHCDGVFL